MPFQIARKERFDPMGTITRESFGQTPDGELIDLYTLTGAGGMAAKIMNFGAAVLQLHAPDPKGNLADVVLSPGTLDAYATRPNYHGTICGRYANRIAKGRFTLDAREYELPVNNGPNHLHGGRKGFNMVVWNAEELRETDRAGLRLAYLSPNGEEGYPGEVSVKVTYWITDNRELRIDYEATTTRPTPINLTNHSYFNLKGHGEGEVLDHLLEIDAESFTVFDDTNIPTGEIRPVSGTRLDFRQPTPIGARIEAENSGPGKGYDHNFVLNKTAPEELSLAARVKDPASGRTMECWTREPGMQLYVAGYNNSKGKDGKTYTGRAAFCLETQHYPDSPNHPHFPDTILRPEGKFESTTIYRFIA